MTLPRVNQMRRAFLALWHLYDGHEKPSLYHPEVLDLLLFLNFDDCMELGFWTFHLCYS